MGFVVWLLHAAWFADLTSEQLYPAWMRSPATNSILTVFFAMGFPATYYLIVGLIRWHQGHKLRHKVVMMGLWGSLLWTIVPILLFKVRYLEVYPDWFPSYTNLYLALLMVLGFPAVFFTITGIVQAVNSYNGDGAKVAVGGDRGTSTISGQPSKAHPKAPIPNSTAASHAGAEDHMAISKSAGQPADAT